MIDITNLTKTKNPNLPFREAKERILGKRYELSLVLANGKMMKELNRKYRKKDTQANTLAFSYSKNEGEIFLNIKGSQKNMISLFIHSLLHLKGMGHGKEMEKEEKYWHNKLKLA